MIMLTVLSHNGSPAEGLAMSFDELGGTIGSAGTNQLVLPGPEHSISRVHARVVFRSHGYAIVDSGDHPISVNGTSLGAGLEHPLQPGDEVRIGGYLLAVSRGAVPAADDPFADLFGAAAVAVAVPPAPVAAPAVQQAANRQMAAWSPMPPLVPSDQPRPAMPAAAPPVAVFSWDGPAVAAPMTSPTITRDASLLAALLDGLATPDLRIEALTPERMRLLGWLLRQSMSPGLDAQPQARPIVGPTLDAPAPEATVATRHARLWHALEALFGPLSIEARRDIEARFGEAFLGACENRLEPPGGESQPG